MTETTKDDGRPPVIEPKCLYPWWLEGGYGRTAKALARRTFLAGARAACRFSRDTIAGEIALQEQAQAPLPDALADGPVSFKEPQRAAQLKTKQRARIRQALFGKAVLGNDE